MFLWLILKIGCATNSKMLVVNQLHNIDTLSILIVQRRIHKCMIVKYLLKLWLTNNLFYTSYSKI